MKVRNISIHQICTNAIYAKGGLTARKTHIGGDNGSLEVNPSFNSAYMPTKAQCVGMGIQFSLIRNVINQ